MTKEKSRTRHRNFATVVYPESAAADWLQILSDWHIPVFVSPLHDSDYSMDGEVKKAHYHVLLMYDGVKTMEQVINVISSINGVGCELVALLNKIIYLYKHC